MLRSKMKAYFHEIGCELWMHVSWEVVKHSRTFSRA